MDRISKLSFAAITTIALLATTACNRRDDTAPAGTTGGTATDGSMTSGPPGAGPTTTSPGMGTTSPSTTEPAMPPASAASR